MDRLREEGAEIKFFDPFISRFVSQGNAYEGERRLTAELIQSADVAVIITAHTKVDYAFVQRHAKAVYDTKNATGHLADRSNIELL